jgi:hypothetical protein
MSWNGLSGAGNSVVTYRLIDPDDTAATCHHLVELDLDTTTCIASSFIHGSVFAAR